jgi:hypothetical protein
MVTTTGENLGIIDVLAERRSGWQQNYPATRTAAAALER